MKKSTMNTLIGSALAAASGIFVYKAYQEQNAVRTTDDSNMSNSAEIDERESVDALEDSAEQGLSQLDSAYRDEWQANAFPQTHKEMRELEEDK
ncbi:hypothetical protein A1A1_06627 [Planococcus antarcticus DSM 14505]|uniref:Uncharacterized protein n=1 Tax=Planococcus antarcticus DSM 14505 TaxID=1185653 RepID=A0A1C7DC96_9BACL|nr:hypothetical protein [Planococcus antarcticus]ANU09002.1 hypothetical protein BBH88_00945 [Planococcus antarcticus DSM 14505]EIM07252.1 hypothetical protein A1A1_06627 [Planococcus antarcticus DSM 14505]